jgi:hypothetical protein
MDNPFKYVLLVELVYFHSCLIVSYRKETIVAETVEISIQVYILIICSLLIIL